MADVAAIDAGSNSIRVLLGGIDSSGLLREVGSLRALIPLGREAFSEGAFSEATMELVVEAFRDFRTELQEAGVRRVAGVATSAFRVARNAAELVERIEAASGIRLEIIDGTREAELIFLAVSGQVELAGLNALLLDLGGGSLELTLARDAQPVAWRSLPVGPVRLSAALRAAALPEAETRRLLEPVKGEVSALVREALGRQPLELVVGTGGTLEALAEVRGQLAGTRSPPEYLGAAEVRELAGLLVGLGPAARETRFGLRRDRAEVLASAAIVLAWLLDECGAERLVIPGAGMKQGLLWEVARALHPEVRRAGSGSAAGDEV